MSDENDTLPSGGTEDVMPENETAESWDYFDPDEDTEAAPEQQATDEGAEEPAATEEQPEPEPVMLSLPDGTKVPADEAVKGYLRQADYSRKTQEASEMRKALEADLQTISNVTEAVIDFLSQMVPQPPDAAMAMRDPQGFVRAKAQHDAAMAKIQQLVELGKTPKDVAARMSDADQQKLIASENALLAEKFPAVAQPEGRAKFFEGAAKAAQELGFSMSDLEGVTDHRMFALAHWANIGLQAAKARETAKAKVANVPPVAPRKPGQPAQSARQQQVQRRFEKNPTLRNAAAAWSGD